MFDTEVFVTDFNQNWSFCSASAEFFQILLAWFWNVNGLNFKWSRNVDSFQVWMVFGKIFNKLESANNLGSNSFDSHKFVLWQLFYELNLQILKIGFFSDVNVIFNIFNWRGNPLDVVIFSQELLTIVFVVILVFLLTIASGFAGFLARFEPWSLVALVVSLIGLLASVIASIVIFSSFVCSLLLVGLWFVFGLIFSLLRSVISSVFLIDIVGSGFVSVIFNDGLDGSWPSVVVVTIVVAIIVVVLVVSIVSSGHGLGWILFILNIFTFNF